MVQVIEILPCGRQEAYPAMISNMGVDDPTMQGGGTNLCIDSFTEKFPF